MGGHRSAGRGIFRDQVVAAEPSTGADGAGASSSRRAPTNIHRLCSRFVKIVWPVPHHGG